MATSCRALVVETFDPDTVLGFTQLFIIQTPNLIRPRLLIAKIVDDFLLTGDVQEIETFIDHSSKFFKAGRFILDRNLIFNRLHIS